MLHTRFDSLREQLLRAGIAPRHVRRYLAELSDHFDDLVREEQANGVALGAAELHARSRLGNNGDLAAVMLARPDLRSLAARYPWAVFGLSPIVMVVAALALCLLLEAAMIVGIGKLVPHATAAQRDALVLAMAVWNTLWSTAAPFAIAAALCVLGLRQRMSPVWILAGIVVACFFGAFQDINFSDDGHHGELSLGSAFFPPFPMKLIVGGLYRLAVTASLAGALYWFASRRQNGAANEQPTPLAAE